MGSTSRRQILHLRGEKMQQAASMGTIQVGYSDRYRKLKWTLNGNAEVHEELYLSSPWMPLFSLQVLPCELRHPTLLHNRLSAELLSRVWGVQPQFLHHVADNITSRALNLATEPPSSLGYSIVAELEFLVEEEDFENFDAHTLYQHSLDEAAAGSRSAIMELIKKGGFVANKSDQGQELLGTCSVCLEELSSPEGAKLLRLDCSHLYHQRCILPWLENRNTCPTCRREVVE